MSFLAETAFAQSISQKVATSAAGPLIQKIIDAVVSPAILILFLVATVIFTWGVFGLIVHGDDAKARKEGQDHILWGVVGMAIMISAYGIVRLLAASVGSTDPFI